MVTKAKPASEVLQDEHSPQPEVDLSGAPKLRPITTLRPRERSPLLALADKFQGYDDKKETSLGEFNDLLAEIDEALESFAVDREKYLAWVVTPAATLQLPALFSRYVGELADFMSSAN